jgi:hypothetical protein
LNERYGKRARDLLLDGKDQWITQGVYLIQPVKKTEVLVKHIALGVTKNLTVPVGHDLVIENNYSQGNAKLVNRTDTFSKQLNIVFAAEITAHEVSLSAKTIVRKAAKTPPTRVPIEVSVKRTKISVKTEPEAQNSYRPPPPRPARD